MEPTVRVQNLVQSGVGQVPPQYIQPLEFLPANHRCLLSSTNIRLIDLSNQRKSIHEAIVRMCRECGAFHVINHGVPLELLLAIRRVGAMSEKLIYSCDRNSAASEGYGSKMLVNNDDTVLDWRDYFGHHIVPLSPQNPSRGAEFPHEYREVMANYSDEMKLLAEILLGFILESLGLHSNYIRDAVGEIIRILRCPLSRSLRLDCKRIQI